MTNRPTGSISLDMDNRWSYLKTHGDEGWENSPSYFGELMPHVLPLLDEYNLKVTFFIVGLDAAKPENAEPLALIKNGGHEVGNHSWSHEPWLHLYDRGDIISEIERTETAIKDATGLKPEGFRGPGFSWSPILLEVLDDMNYLFDASTLPTFIGPLARAYYFFSSHFDKEARKKRGKLFGTLKDGFRPIKPYKLSFTRSDGTTESILEIPVTTMPFFRVPFHLSYLVWLARYSRFVMKAYLRLAIFFCKLTGVVPSVLLHPLDFLGCDKINDLGFFPGMDRTTEWKTGIFREAMDIITKHFNLVPMGKFARLLKDGELR